MWIRSAAAQGPAAVRRPLKLLHSGSNLTIVLRMGQPEQSVQLTPVQVHDLNQKLSTFRHNVNNHLSLMIAAIELMKRKPEMAARLVETLAEQPEKITCEMRVFSDEFDKALGIARS